MALETVVYPQDPSGYGWTEFSTVGGGAGGYDSSSSSVMQNGREWDPNSLPEARTGDGLFGKGSPIVEPLAAATSGRRKRRRTRNLKNKEELEKQRRSHIEVERKRRKQMNEYLDAIRSLMPSSYVQRGDQASIIGGAINFLKDLEQHHQNLEAQNRINQPPNIAYSPIFADFFTFPQYSTRSTHSNKSSGMPNEPMVDSRPTALAEIEVTMAESHANLKILSRRRPRQLLKIVAGLQCLWLTILHLNVTKVDQLVLYTVSVKLEEGCQLTTVEEIADSVNHLLGRIQEDAPLS